jgi:hypothetical protein
MGDEDVKSGRLSYLIILLSLKGWERNMEERTKRGKGTKGGKERKTAPKYVTVECNRVLALVLHNEDLHNFYSSQDTVIR